MTPWLLPQRFRQVTAPLSNGTTDRLDAHLEAVVDQFNVETAERYQAANGMTWCNKFACDVTAALGCPLPFTLLHGATWRESRANDLFDWLMGESGVASGWELLKSEHVAKAMADEGQVVLAAWKNTNPPKPGHIAILLPSHGAEGLWIAQAGAKNLERAPIADGFGTLKFTLFAHA